jgi:protein gp37
MAIRFAGPGGKYEGLVRSTDSGPRWTGVVRLVESQLDKPVHWQRPRNIFVCSMSDLFHEDVTREMAATVFDTIGRCERHTFQILTKRPERMAEFMDWWLLDVGRERPLPNVWLGTSIEDQETAARRIPALLHAQARVRFLSVEPLLGSVALGMKARSGEGEVVGGSLDGLRYSHETVYDPDAIGWVIAGGESGPGARPTHPDWIRGVREQCRVAGVPFFFKQWGEFAPREAIDGGEPGDQIGARAVLLHGTTMYRVGKGSAGRVLDGRTYDEMPATAQR